MQCRKNILKLLPFSMLMLALTVLNGCSNGQVAPVNKKVLIVYLSRTNNTKVAAEMIQGFVGGRIVPLELVKTYPEDYKETVAQVARENETGFLPELKTKIENITQYDLIFIGFPTWGMQMPPPMKSFLKNNDLTGKTVIPFNTNAGYGLGSTIETVKALCPRSTITEPYTTKGGVERDGQLLMIKEKRAGKVKADIENWLKKIKVI